MVRIVGPVLALLLALPAAWAEDKPKDRPDTPADQYKALVQDYQKDLKEAKALPDQMKLAQKYAPKFLELAEKNPKDPAAVDALVWVATNVRSPQQRDSRRATALELLARDHADSPKVGPVCQTMDRAFDKESGEFLRAVLDKNPSRDLQGQACLALAHYLKTRGQILDALKQQPNVAGILEQMVGKEYTAELKKLDPDKGNKEVAELFERAAEKYADVKLPGGGTVGDKVKPELARVKNLGKLEVNNPAPDIEGEDIEGKKFKLSDYKGKVVLLDFWGNW
jgi:hypothetical protein